MGAGVPDYRGLVPRIPPEGLREWVLKACAAELGRHGLVYEVEYAQDYGLCQLLDAWAEPKKIKMVRVTCSCCGDSMLLNWAKDEKRGYGFVLPDDEEGDWPRTVTAAGDEAACPTCGETVLVNKRAAVRDYYVTAECQVMSAAVLEAGALVLTGWTVQRRVYKSGRESLEFLPAEAYVFTPTDCFQLMGWRNGYSGTAGYFIQYGPWRQPKAWAERWGRENNIFGLTPELVGRSCLPHCKLDVYMAQRPGAAHYPVAYLRLYQAHPNVEAVLLHGLPRVLDDLISAKTEAWDWGENQRGRLELPEIDWGQTRPAQMLRLTKEELRMARGQDWGKLFWDLFLKTKAAGELLTAEDIQNAFCLGDEHLTRLIPRGQVGKSIRYLLRQYQMLACEADDAGADPVPDAQILADYWDMAEQKGMEGAADLFRVRRRLLQKYTYVARGLLIRPAASQRELTAEGDALRHCVGTYGKRHAAGETAIFFIRRTDRPRESYFTLELDEKKLEVRQNRGLRNCVRTPEVEAFEQEWLAWVRAGAPRDRNGRPVRADQAAKKGREKGAA